MPFDTLNKVQENFDQGISDSLLDYDGWCEKSFFLPRLLPASENIQAIGPILSVPVCKQRASGSDVLCDQDAMMTL